MTLSNAFLQGLEGAGGTGVAKPKVKIAHKAIRPKPLNLVPRGQ
jgi:hypothetical protein